MKPGAEKGAVTLTKTSEYSTAVEAVDSLDVDVHWGLSQFVAFKTNDRLRPTKLTADESAILRLGLEKVIQSKESDTLLKNRCQKMLDQIVEILEV